MSDTKSKQAKREWGAGWGTGLTGPTTPAVSPVCSGKDWPYTPVHCGMETIAICPEQEGCPGSGEKHARLIAAAPELLAVAECEEALSLPGCSGWPILEKHGWDPKTNVSPSIFVRDIRRAAIAKATGSES